MRRKLLGLSPGRSRRLEVSRILFDITSLQFQWCEVLSYFTCVLYPLVDNYVDQPFIFSFECVWRGEWVETDTQRKHRH